MRKVILENNNPIYFIASARDYHAVDWYKTIKELNRDRLVLIISEIIKGEDCNKIVNDEDVILVFGLDKFLFTKQSYIGSLWRNFLKLIISPLFIIKIKQLYRKNPNSIFHAHSMYYIFICWLSSIRFIATPMGSDVLVRPNHSLFYKIFTSMALRKASIITVDSHHLYLKVKELSNSESHLIQNGIDCVGTGLYRQSINNRCRCVSARAIDINYRIKELVHSRNIFMPELKLDFIYPYYENSYLKTVRSLFQVNDSDFGKLNKDQMYQLFSESCLVISIPTSDSSPRTVYEAIFCGACVAVSYNSWIDSLPFCMKDRLIVIDLSDPNWLKQAWSFASKKSKTVYIPSKEAVQIFDQYESMKIMNDKFYSRIPYV